MTSSQSNHTLGNTSSNSLLHVPLTIDQTYVEPPVFDLVHWEIFIIITCAVLLLCCILCTMRGIMANSKSNHKDTSTATNDAANTRKPELLLYKVLAVFILIASLLFATYCGVLFLVQNDKHWKRYSIPFECKVDANDTCLVRTNALIFNHAVEREEETNRCDPCGGGTFTGIYYESSGGYQYSEYSDFYNDTFEPYVKGLDDTMLMKRFENNPVLRLRFKTQDVSDYPDRWNSGTNSYERIRLGYLYLSEEGLSDSDVTLAQRDYDYPNDCDCCCKRRQAICFCVKKGENEGCECYCYRAAYWDYDKELVVQPSETCCECCCCCCGGLPCHTVCGSCALCCVTFSVCISILLILILFCYYWAAVEDYYNLGLLKSFLNELDSEL